MEKQLDKQLDEIMTFPKVIGAACTDTKGLCLGAKGAGQKLDTGVIATIANQATKLHPESKDSPVISIESDAGLILIKSHDNVTTAVYKST